MSDLTSLFTDTLAKFSFRAVLSAAATLLICLVAVHLLGKLLRRRGPPGRRTWPACL